jgi:outer membrane protein OmpA-like peptidoglycan-associated protein
MEGEVGYRENDGRAPDLRRVLSDVRLKEWTGMINAVYDIKMGSDKWGLAVGAGIGIDNPRYTAPDGTDSNDKVFAAQALAGFTYRVNQHWDLMLNYRYLWAGEAEFQASAAPIERTMDLEKHTITVGFRYGYDDPPVIVVPPDVVVIPPPKQFIIFFGFNKCNVTAEADAVLSEAASSAKSGGGASVRIVGHTDTSGSNAYNQKLSECRANAAKSNLVGKGVSEGSISTSGKGETELMVQTGDRVKEPQNRRATIDLN